MSDYYVIRYDAAGRMIDVISGANEADRYSKRFKRLEYVRVENGVGAMTLVMPAGKYTYKDFAVNQTLEIWRDAGKGFKLQNETAYFLRDWTFIQSQGEDLVELTALDANWLLSTRIVGYKPGTAQAEKSDYADDMMKEVVKENLGSNADGVTAWTVTETRILPRFSIENDSHASVSLDREFAWRNVLEVCQELAASATEQGTNTYFDVVRTAPATFKFKTYTGQRGKNHGKNTIDARFVRYFHDISFETLHAGEYTFVVGGGAGSGADQLIDPERARDRVASGSPYNYIEKFLNVGGAETLQAVADAAYAELTKCRPRQILTGTMEEADSMRYNISFKFGDIVVAGMFGYFVDCHVSRVQGIVEADGTETLTIKLEGEL